MRAEVVHEEIVRVVNEEVERVEHVPVVLEHGHLQRRLNDLLDLSLGLLSVVDKLYGLLLVLLP